MSCRPLTGVLVIGGERIVVEFSGESAERIGRALAAGSAARRRQLERSVRGYRAEHPDAPANELVRVIGGNRQDVLAADRAVTGRARRDRSVPLSGSDSAERLVPSPENHAEEVDPDDDGGTAGGSGADPALGEEPEAR